MVPFPDAPDRLSPSGPFLPIARAGLIRGGSDCPREPITYPAPGPFIFQRSSAPNDFIQIPLPNFRPGNSILTVATVTFTEEPSEAVPSVLVQCPAILIGPQTFTVDNAFSVMGMNSNQGDTIRTLTQAALWQPDPALVTQDPLIGWFGVVGGNVPIKIPGGPLASAEGTNSWFMAFEIGEDSITQLGPTTLTPLP